MLKRKFGFLAVQLLLILALLVTCLLHFDPYIQTARAQSIFTDNFDDGVADGWTAQLGSWSVINGEYRISVGMVENGISTVDGFNLTDCTLETKLRFTDAVGFRAGIIFRYIDSEHYYSFEPSNEYDNCAIFKYSPGNTAYGQVFAVLEGYQIQQNLDYMLKVIVQGNNFRCFINGQEVISGTDESYTSGKVGLRARRADVNFDNFRVSNGTPPPNASGDEFNAPTLDSKWTVIDPDGGSTFSLSANPGWLRITSPSGRDLLPSKFNAPRISQSVTGDFTVETKISAITDENDEGAGICIWKDNNNYVRLERMSRTIGHPVQQQILFGGSVGGVWPSPGDTQVVLTSNVNPTYLKLTKSHGVLTGYYSSDGTGWNQVGTISFALSDPVNIGLAVVNEYHTSSFYADFDYFRMYNAVVPTPTGSGLVGHWKLDEGSGLIAYDSSGNGNNGNLIGGPTWVAGKFGKALNFDGIDDYVSIPDSSSLRVQSFSLLAWIYMTVRPYQAGHPGHPHVCIINKMHYYGTSVKAGYKLDFEYPTSSDDTLVLTIGDGVAQRFLAQYNSISDLTLNQWHLVAGTYDGSQGKLYIDGQLKATGQGSYIVLNDNTPLCLSREVSQPEYDGFNGRIDEAMIYNRALSAQEVTSIFNAQAVQDPSYSELQALVSSLESQVNSLNSQVASLQSQMGGLQSQIQTLQSEKVNLTTQLNSANTQITALQSQVTSLNSQITSLNSNVVNLTAQKNNLTTQLDTANTQITSLQSQIAGLQTTAISSQSQISSLQSQVQTLSSEKANIQTQLNTVQSSLDAANSQKASLTTSLNDANSQKLSLQNQLNDADTQRTNLQTQLGDLQLSLDDANAKMNTTNYYMYGALTVAIVFIIITAVLAVQLAKKRKTPKEKDT